MNITIEQSLWGQANQLVQEAKKELNTKGHFDPYLTCMNCKHSIIKFLNSYLIDRDETPDEMQTMSVLLEQCKRIDPEFEQIDLSEINCRFEKINEDFCTDRSKLEHCVEVTSEVMEMTHLE